MKKEIILLVIFFILFMSVPLLGVLSCRYYCLIGDEQVCILFPVVFCELGLAAGIVYFFSVLTIKE